MKDDTNEVRFCVDKDQVMSPNDQKLIWILGIDSFKNCDS